MVHQACCYLLYSFIYWFIYLFELYPCLFQACKHALLLIDLSLHFAESLFQAFTTLSVKNDFDSRKKHGNAIYSFFVYVYQKTIIDDPVLCFRSHILLSWSSVICGAQSYYDPGVLSNGKVILTARFFYVCQKLVHHGTWLAGVL